jgi:hypothetical protein
MPRLFEEKCGMGGKTYSPLSARPQPHQLGGKATRQRLPVPTPSAQSHQRFSSPGQGILAF